jgi:hypothetical protein
MVPQKIYFYFYLNATDLVHFMSRVDFHLLKRRGRIFRNIFGGVQAAPLSELQQGFGIWVKAFHTK